jgi:hypothetical protein
MDIKEMIGGRDLPSCIQDCDDQWISVNTITYCDLSYVKIFSFRVVNVNCLRMALLHVVTLSLKETIPIQTLCQARLRKSELLGFSPRNCLFVGSPIC